MDDGKHNRTIVEQFSKQAIHFAKLSGHEGADKILLEMAHPTSESQLLDVACGPGLLACSFAPHVGTVTGIDITPAMIDRAKAMQAQRGLLNLQWHVGDVSTLPFSTGHFDIAITRYSFHHFVQPQSILAEMVRVVRRGGRIVIADLVLPSSKSQLYDLIERRRDPSHVHVLSQEDLEEMVGNVGLVDIKVSGYRFELDLDVLIAGSFPNPDDRADIRRDFEADIGYDMLGVGLTNQNGQVTLSYPIAIVAGVRPH